MKRPDDDQLAVLRAQVARNATWRWRPEFEVARRELRRAERAARWAWLRRLLGRG